MAVGFTEALPPAPGEAISELEARLGVSLPDDYRSFLREQNGGYLDDNFLPPEGDASARYLYSAGPNDHEHIDDLESAFHYLYLPDVDAEYRLRTGMLPVGEDEGGNRVCLKVAGEDYGSVWFWTHDATLDEDPFERLADSFSEFLEALRPIEELDLG
jgi:cell wall assembly regulator SMI1